MGVCGFKTLVCRRMSYNPYFSNLFLLFNLYGICVWWNFEIMAPATEIPPGGNFEVMVTATETRHRNYLSNGTKETL